MKQDVKTVKLLKDVNGDVRRVTDCRKITFGPNGKADCVNITVTQEYELKLSDRVVIEMPQSCYDCPCGFIAVNNSYGKASNTCGRNIPWTYIDSQKRPSTCKLRTLEQYLKEMKNN